jgi:hypothetical protein
MRRLNTILLWIVSFVAAPSTVWAANPDPETQLDADTHIQLVEAAAKLTLDTFRLDFSKLSDAEAGFVRLYALEAAQCGMRSIEVWPLKYRRGFYARFRETANFIEAKKYVEQSIMNDFRAKTISGEEFLSWGTRIEAIANSCERRSRNGEFDRALQDIALKARK